VLVIDAATSVVPAGEASSCPGHRTVASPLPRRAGPSRSEEQGKERVMQLTERRVGHVTILDLAGKLTIDQAAERLKDKINSLAQQDRTAIILNLAEVPYIDSGGLGQLVSSYSSLSKTAGGLRLLHLTKRNHDLLAVTRLATIFQTFDSEDEAIRSFDPLPASLPLASVH
jgi:anti-sigma B factor antagonist